jgi:hypothetical protein
METETPAFEAEEDEIPDRCLCDLCNQICDYELDVNSLNDGLDHQIYLCKSCYRSILSYYWGETQKEEDFHHGNRISQTTNTY